MTLKDLYENQDFRKEIGKAFDEAKPDGEEASFDLFIKTARKYGVETNENEIRAFMVSCMPVSDDELDKVSGGRGCGTFDNPCGKDQADYCGQPTVEYEERNGRCNFPDFAD